MFYKTIVLTTILMFALNLIQKTDCLFVSVGVYPNYTKYGVNLPECGKRYIPRYVNITRSSECFQQGPHNVSVPLLPGTSSTKVDSVSSRIFNGRDAMVGESPWTVRLDIKFTKPGEIPVYPDDRCSGSLITFEWILTAAHCVEESNIVSVEVMAGFENWKSVNMNKIFRHPGYDTISIERWKHDIALIKLQEKYDQELMEDNHYLLNTICLSNESELNKNEEFATFAGWGRIDTNGRLPKRLQIAQEQLKPNHLCPSGFICAEFVSNQSRTCKGDSGAPLYQFSNEQVPRAIQIGVLRGGQGEGCGPGVSEDKWTPPMSFIPWILDTIANN